eukprot:CAMPEP_0173399588 /NCGR_PEP_ID=MMETSP1356-20130122/45363_1 /TAXON_ID=77927 ORGANISM="Hemiselmis virescens, Strain PCC157" /NCGR_SAMPLE_ID=MMETSP1356 /ASSEMBLY_ACC=CAM_ASM_000847 /LENGTH=311 /DNA_ID=CAMNT_0014359333 /DNA_START=18 /DNA_END=953 /DNA_ORIENTATION=+
MAVLSIIAIFLVSEKMLDISFKVEFTIFAAGCIFPTTFSASNAFSRREKAVADLAKLKANVISLFHHFIFFDIGGKSEAALEAKNLFEPLVDHIEMYCRNAKSTQVCTIVDARDGERGANSAAHYIYDDFVVIAEALQKAGTKHFGHSGAKAVENTNRSWNYIHDAIAALEGLRSVRTTSTPLGLRIFCHFLLHSSCLLLAPFWVHFCKSEVIAPNKSFASLNDDLGVDTSADGSYGCVSAYLVGLFFTFIVLTLYRVVSDLEDPFDGRGDDDVDWAIWREELDALGQSGEDGPRLRSEGGIFMPPPLKSA